MMTTEQAFNGRRTTPDGVHFYALMTRVRYLVQNYNTIYLSLPRPPLLLFTIPKNHKYSVLVVEYLLPIINRE